MRLHVLLILFCSILTTSAIGQDTIVVDWSAYFTKIKSADSLYQKGEFLQSAKAYSTAFSQNNQGFSAGHRYNAACAWAMCEQADSAVLNLKKEVAFGYTNYKKLISEKAFSILHKKKRLG